MAMSYGDREHGGVAPVAKVGARTLLQALGGDVPASKVGARTLVEQLEGGSGAAQRAAAMGTAGGGGPLPHFDTIQQAFGRHDVSGIEAHVGGDAATATHALGAEAYATGHHVAFAGAPSVHTAAHEAAHVVQQRAGIQLKGGVGTAGDPHERHADAVADAVVRGDSAEPLLDQYASGGGHAGGSPTGDAVQRQESPHPAGDEPAVDGDPAAVDGDPAAAAPDVAQLFAMGGPQAWPVVLPQSSVRAGGLTMDPGGRTRGGVRAPALVVPRPRRGDPPAAAPTDVQAEAVRLATETIEARLNAIEIPATSGELLIYRGGYAYRAHTHRDGSADAAAHDDYMHSDNPLGLTSARDRRRWEIFQFVTGEGDTSAINAYDSQRVTIGAGFSAVSGAAGQMLNRLPAPMRQRLFDHGILLETDNSFAVFDTSRGVVERGENALRVLQVDPRRLAVFSTLAQSTEDVSDGTTTRSEREWMLRAQFEQATSSIPAAVFDWPLAIAKVAIKLQHWQSGVATWGRLVGWAGAGADLSAMCRGARDAIWRHHGQPTEGAFSLDAIEERFTQRASQARAGTITWAPRPGS
jgi:hypothetical protein